MKAIQLKRIAIVGRIYRIYLGNGYLYDFASLRLAKAFLSATNTYLTGVLFDLNDLYKITHGLYRDNWLLFYHNKKGLKSQNFADNIKCEKLLRGCSDCLEHAFTSAPAANGGTWVFQNFNVTIDYLEEILLLLLSYHKKRSETLSIYAIRGYLARLADLRASLRAYGVNKADGVYSVNNLLNSVNN